MKVMVDPELPNHRKLWRLAKELKVTEGPALGHLVALWCAVMRQSETGDLTAWTTHDIARAAAWGGDQKRLVASLIAAGFLERHGRQLRVHEWQLHQCDFIEKRRQWRDRQAKRRSVTRDTSVSHAGVTRESPTAGTGTSSGTVPLPVQSSSTPPTVTQGNLRETPETPETPESRAQYVNASRFKIELSKSEKVKQTFLMFLGWLENNPAIPGHRILEFTNKLWNSREGLIGDNGLPADKIFCYALEQTMKYNAFQPSYVGKVMAEAVMKWREGVLKF